MDEDHWTDANGELVIPDSELEEWNISVAERGRENGLSTHGRSQVPAGVEIHGKKQEDLAAELGPHALPQTYYTLGEGRFPDHVDVLGGVYWAIKGGVQFNVSALSVEIDLTFQIGSVSIAIWSWEIGYGKSRGLCTDITPGKFPLAVDLCVDAKFGDGDLVLGGSVDLCTPPDDLCGRFLDCQYCLTNVGLSTSVDVPDAISDRI